MVWKTKFLLVLIFVLCLGCQNQLKDEASFFKWINNPDNGLIKKTSANGFTLTMKYLPSSFLAYLERTKTDENTSLTSDDSEQNFEGSRTFLFSFENERNNVDVTTYGVYDLSEYKRRINELNFNIKKYIYLKDKNGNRIKPVLTSFENIYEVDGKKSFYIVFSKEEESKKTLEKLDIVFEDEFFDTGISHFVFDKNQLDNIPSLQF